MAAHNKLGNEGEQMAQQFLITSGYTILEINWRTSRLEIDIIALKNNELHIIEVKTRQYITHSISELITKKKMKNLLEASSIYLEKNAQDFNLVFSVLLIIKEDITLIEDAFKSWEVD